MSDTTEQKLGLPLGPNGQLIGGRLVTNKNGDAEWYKTGDTFPTLKSNKDEGYTWKFIETNSLTNLRTTLNATFGGNTYPTNDDLNKAFYSTPTTVNALNGARLNTFNSPTGLNSPQLAKQLSVPGSKTADPPAKLDPNDPTKPLPIDPNDPIKSVYIDENFTRTGTATTKADPKYQDMRYPLKNYKDGTYDYLHISAVRFKESGLRTTAESFNVVSTQKREKDIYANVFLPMQPGISDTNGVSWNEDPLNPFQAALGGLAAKTISVAGSGDVVNAARGLAQGLIDTGTNLANNKSLQNYISAYFAGQAVGTNLVARTTGTVLNNNLELLFNGPKLRTFRYSYRFTPRDEDEARMVRRIIRFFKREMSPEVVATGLFLASPNVFRLKYISRNKDRQNPFLNKIKFCALTDMSVNYTPDGTYMTYQDGSMTSYEVELQFSELEPIYKNDYDEDNEDVNDPKSMGY